MAWGFGTTYNDTTADDAWYNFSGCDILPDPENGFISSILPSIGGTAQYSCDLGFVLIGEATRTCSESLIWSGMAPTCEGENKDILCMAEFH